MSVINQMLKDLDQRQAKQAVQQEHSNALQAQPSARYRLIFTAVALVAISIVGWFSWQLYQENQQLKAQGGLPQQAQLAETSVISKLPTQAEAVSVSQVKVAAKLSTRATQPSTRATQASTSDTINTKAEGQTTTEQTTKAQIARTAKNDKVTNVPTEPTETTEPTEPNKPTESTEPLQANEQSHTSDSIAEQAVAMQSSVKPIVNQLTSQPEQIEQSEQPEQLKQAQPSLTISRVQLSPQALAQQKFTKAEQAIASNDISAGEQLLEEILLILPEHQSARKQLAALWYGRQLYQPALNLLSQGIAITPTNSEYRLMKARIYIALNQQQRALDTLLELANTNEVEYQGLLATTAQQLKHYQHTINAYNQLTQLQPSVGRWWLGLAVAYDSDGQFIEAAGTYRRAIALANLSESARQFSRQRLEQLGG